MGEALELAVDEFTGKYFINEDYRPLANKLRSKYSELQHVPVKHILFLENREDKRKKGQHFVFAQVSKISGKIMDVLYQVTGHTYEYIIEIFKPNVEDMSREQIVLLLYHEMRHIGVDGKLVEHEINDWVSRIRKA